MNRWLGTVAELEAELDAARDAVTVNYQRWEEARDRAEKAEQERDSLRLRVVALEAAARKYAEFHGPSDCRECGGDDCEAHATSECRCGGPAIDRELNAAIRACLEAGDTTALRAMLVEAARQGHDSCTCMEGDLDVPEAPEAIADRILGASKEGGE